MAMYTIQSLVRRGGEMNVLKIPIVHGDRETHDSTDGMMDAYDPATGEVIARFSCAGADEVNAVVGAARVAFDDGPWRKMRPFERGRIMQRIADGIMKRRDELVRMECRDSGKPLRDAYWEIDCAARNFEFYGGAADKLQGSSIPLGDGWMDWTIREPVDVSLHIVPWNYPFQFDCPWCGAGARRRLCGNYQAVGRNADDSLRIRENLPRSRASGRAGQSRARAWIGRRRPARAPSWR